jgi:glucan phosphoethanolaminetransferase (alkaline phosphatase superfamily)
MGTSVLRKSWFSPIISYSMLSWTILCFVGTWFIILRYGILLEGLIAVVITFFFAATVWVIPLTGLILLSLFVTPSEESRPFVMFKELIQKGMGRS